MIHFTQLPYMFKGLRQILHDDPYTSFILYYDPFSDGFFIMCPTNPLDIKYVRSSPNLQLITTIDRHNIDLHLKNDQLSDLTCKLLLNLWRMP